MKKLYIAFFTIVLANSSVFAQYFGGSGDGAAYAALGSSGGEVALPITLIYFGAKLSKGIVSTAWITASETNNDYFSVERGTDGINFLVIGTVNGAGNSNQRVNYSLIDREPLAGNSYYRLKQTDFDGKYQYSTIVAVTSNSTTIAIYPNPSNGMFTVAGIYQNTDLLIVNSLGEKIATQKITSLTTDIDISNAPNGIYYLYINSEKEFSVKKISITH